VHVLREQREYAVISAAQRERDAWMALEQAARPDHEDDAVVRAARARWQTAARSLVEALRALKTSRR
jgi:hypothetical protein